MSNLNLIKDQFLFKLWAGVLWEYSGDNRYYLFSPMKFDLTPMGVNQDDLKKYEAHKAYAFIKKNQDIVIDAEVLYLTYIESGVIHFKIDEYALKFISIDSDKGLAIFEHPVKGQVTFIKRKAS